MCGAIVLETATTIRALTGVLLFDIVPDVYLYALFAAILFLSAQQMFTGRRDPVLPSGPAVTKGWAAALRLDSSYPDRELGRDVYVSYSVHRVPLGMMLMHSVGLLSALLGIGS